MTNDATQHPAAGSKFDDFKRHRFGSDAFRTYFRTDFIERDAGFEYLGLRNGFCYAALCLLPVALIVITLAAAVDFSSQHWLLLPVYFLICNLAEYLVHRFPMHRRMGPRNIIYAHVTIHHNFYNDEHFYFEQPRDLMASLLPWYAFLGVSLIIAAVGGIIWLLGGLNDALFFAFVAYSYYLLYEVLHAAYHTPPDSMVKRIPFVTGLARAHLNHHRYEHMAHSNFNITFPIFDRLLGTLLTPTDEKTIAGNGTGTT